jgi:hypothetical protein
LVPNDEIHAATQERARRSPTTPQTKSSVVAGSGMTTGVAPCSKAKVEFLKALPSEIVALADRVDKLRAADYKRLSGRSAVIVA